MIKSRVYFIRAQRDEGDLKLAHKAEQAFLKLGLTGNLTKESFVALKIHFGEKGNTGFIRPPWLSRIISQVQNQTPRVFLTDTNTLYSGQRTNAIQHIQLAWNHGFAPEKVGIPVIIADGLLGQDSEELEVNLSRIKSAKVAAAIIHSDYLVCLSHFTGHIVTGFGASIKNLGMGCASRAGKLEQHSDVHPKVKTKACTNCGICLDYCPSQAILQKDGSAFIQEERCIGCGECLVVCKQGAVKMRWDADARRIQEKMAEYAYSVWRHFQGKIGFLNFLMKMTKDCDCLARDQPTIVEDIGILSSPDTVALDKASVDMVMARSGRDVLRSGYDIDWSVQLRHAAHIGLGSLDYELIEIE
ncbi:MAG: DUF362 domain-containing protein [Candidatus Aminicenantales bacterium]